MGIDTRTVTRNGIEMPIPQQQNDSETSPSLREEVRKMASLMQKIQEDNTMLKREVGLLRSELIQKDRVNQDLKRHFIRAYQKNENLVNNWIIRIFHPTIYREAKTYTEEHGLMFAQYSDEINETHLFMSISILKS